MRGSLEPRGKLRLVGIPLVEGLKTLSELAPFCSVWSCQHCPMGTSLCLVPICPHP